MRSGCAGVGTLHAGDSVRDHQARWQGGVYFAGLGMCIVRHRLQDDDPGVHQGDASMGQAADDRDRRRRREAPTGIDDDVGAEAFGDAGQGGQLSADIKDPCP